jgi:membrane protease subunit HflC
MTEIVRDNRADLMVKIRAQVNQEGSNLGSAAVHVRIRAPDLPRQISEKVFSRIQSERAREAAEYRAKGSETAQTITATADRDVVVVAARSAKLTRRGATAMRKETAFLPRPTARTRISLPSIAQCKPMKLG